MRPCWKANGFCVVLLLVASLTARLRWRPLTLSMDCDVLSCFNSLSSFATRFPSVSLSLRSCTRSKHKLLA